MPVTSIPGSNVRDNTITNADVATGAAIDAAKIGNGTVSNTHWSYLTGLTGNVQQQLNGSVVLNAPDDTRNTVSSTTPGVTPLVVRASPDNSEFTDTFRVESNGGGVVFTVGQSDDNTFTGEWRCPVVMVNNSLVFTNSGSGSATVSCDTTISAAVDFVLPRNAGTTGQVLRRYSGGSEWTDIPTQVAGSSGQVQFNSSGAFAGNAGFTFTAIGTTLTVGTSSSAGVVRLNNGGTVVFQQPTGGGTNTLTLGVAGALSSSYTLTLPASVGAANQVLLNQGSGTLGWSDAVLSMGRVNDTNVTLSLSNLNGAYTLTLGWTGTLAISRGGTGAGTAAAARAALIPTTAKGDLLTHNGTDNIALTVGANDTLLVADSGQTGGIKWAKPDHGTSLTGLADDDHTQYLLLTPTGSTRNVLTPSSRAFTPLTIKGASTGTAASNQSLFRITDESNALIVGVTLNGSASNYSANTPHVSVLGGLTGCGTNADNGIGVAAVAPENLVSGGGSRFSFVAPSGGFVTNVANVFPADPPAANQTLVSTGQSGDKYPMAWAGVISTIAKVDDTNVTLAVATVNRTSTLTLGWTGTLAISRGGTGQGTATGAFAALSPMTTNGDLITRSAGSPARLGIGTTGQLLTVVSGAPAWADPPVTIRFAESEVPTGTVNGSNAAFTLANSPVTGSLKVYKNGIRQQAGSGNDYTLSGTTITFQSGNIPQTGDVLLCDYRY